jgi:type VI secretion system protein ImpL
MKRFFSWVMRRIVLSAMATIVFSLLVWFEGPFVAFNDHFPFASETVRWSLIGFMAFVWCAYWCWQLVKEKIAATKLTKMVAGDDAVDAVPAGSAEISAEMAKLSARMKEAIETLRKTRQDGASGQIVYRLPWYMFVGAPGSGKTTALLNSGLKFPLSGTLGSAPIGGIAGTRNCDWWFTDEAVLLDTAGRYTTQDSYAEVDNAAWHGFLDMLKKYRRRRPINGVIVVISAADMLQKSEPENKRLGLAIRARIKELHEHLGIRFPIYVMVTKCDLLAGFMEFFETMPREEQGQVWGFTFPLEGAEQIDNVLASFPAEFQLLETQLQARVVERMQQERDMQRRALVYGFPQQFAGMGESLTRMLNEIFTSTHFEERAMLRGVYFTSGTQEGSPIDRVIGSLASAFGIERQALPAAAASGRSFFVMQLLRAVVFREAGLAGANLQLERNRRLLQWGALCAMVLLLIVVLGGRTTSYVRNLDYVNALAQRTALAEKLSTSTPPNADMLVTLSLLNTLRALPFGYSERNASVPLLMRLGLYQGEKLGPAAIDAYQRLLQEALLPGLVTRLEEQLRRGAANNADYLYEGLRMYLMLGDARHFDAEALQAWFDLDLQTNFPDLSDLQRQQFGEHVFALLETLKAKEKPVVKLDARLISETQLVLARVPMSQRIYERMKQSFARAPLAEFSAAAVSGQEASLVLMRNSGEPLTRGIAGMYTLAGYRQFLEKMDQAIAEVTLENWVIGQQEAIASLDAITQTKAAVKQLYYNDYIRLWDLYLADIGIVPFSSLDEGARLTAVLAGPDSPLRQFMQAAATETKLERASAATQMTDAVASGVQAKLKTYKNRLSLALGNAVTPPAAPIKPYNPVDAHFKPLHTLVGTPPAPGAPVAAPAPIDQILGLLKDAAVYFEAAARAKRAGTPMPPADALLKIKREAQDKPAPFAAMLQNIDSIGSGIALDSDRARLNAAWAANAGLFCRQAIGGRYPLVRTSAIDVTADDFGRFFAPGGIIDDFFQKNLLPYVDMSDVHWRWRPEAASTLGISLEVLAEFERAATIRDMFFSSGGKLASMRFELKPLAADTSFGNVLLEIDGQALNHVPNGAVTPVLFQVPSGKRTGLVRFETTPAGKLPDLMTEGAWAWLRMIDRGALESTAQNERFKLNFNLEGRKISYELTASSVINPFRRDALEQFHCPEQL